MTAQNASSHPRNIFILALILVAAFGGVDYLTGYELAFFAFYYIPISLAAWRAGRSWGYAIAVSSALAWFLAEYFSLHEYSSILYLLWNVFIRFISFMVVAYFVSRIKALLLEERLISDELRDTVKQVRVLKGLLPICASCKSIRDDKGSWHRMEEYIQKHTDAQFTHGYCPECAAKIRKEAGLEQVGTKG